MSIRPGWFWHPDEEPHSLARLFDTYIASVGANACFHLNVPPDTRGLIDDRDAARLKEFGDLLRQEFGTPVPAAVDEIAGRPPMQKQYRIRFDAPKTGLRYIVLEEDIAKGQRVESFTVTGAFAGNIRSFRAPVSVTKKSAVSPILLPDRIRLSAGWTRRKS